jgi:hypothetical protein
LTEEGRKEGKKEGRKAKDGQLRKKGRCWMDDEG